MPGTKRAAVNGSKDQAATFDFDAFLTGFKRPEFSASLIQRTDLAPQLTEQARILDELDESIDRMEKAEGDDGVERDITAANPLVALTRRRQELTEQYNELAQVYNASAVEFTFRVPDQKDDQARIQQMMDETGLTQPDRPDTEGLSEEEAAPLTADFERTFELWWDALAIRSMSVTCTKHPGTAMGAPPLTVEQWEALRNRVGAASFNTLGTAWFSAVQAAAPAAPFSLRPSRTPSTGE